MEYGFMLASLAALLVVVLVATTVGLGGIFQGYSDDVEDSNPPPASSSSTP